MTDRLFESGEVIGDRFELTQPLGKGAFGAVWKAEDRQRDRAPVAIKILLDRYQKDKKMLGRFVQEAKILEKLDHPNICKPLAWNAAGDDVYLAMEFIDGETLDQKFAGNARDGSPVPPEGIAWICDQLASAISYAHDNDIVHRDLKPKNVMVNRRGARPFVKVLDFGIAKMLVGSEIDPTTVGRVLGSVLYISPEQVLGQQLTKKADIFSLGTIFFELITLKRTWARDDDGRPLDFHKVIGGGSINSHVAVLRRIAREGRPLATAERPGLSPMVDAVLHKAMAIKPEERYESALEFAAALRAALTEGDASGARADEEVPTLGPTLVGDEVRTPITPIADAVTELDSPPPVSVDSPASSKPNGRSNGVVITPVEVGELSTHDGDLVKGAELRAKVGPTDTMDELGAEATNLEEAPPAEADARRAQGSRAMTAGVLMLAAALALLGVLFLLR